MRAVFGIKNRNEAVSRSPEVPENKSVYRALEMPYSSNLPLSDLPAQEPANDMLRLKRIARFLGLLLALIQVTLLLGGCIHHSPRNRNAASAGDASNGNTPPSKEELARPSGALSPAIRRTVVQESFMVSPADYREFGFRVSDKGTLEGKFSIDNGEAGKFNVLVVDDGNFEKLRHGGRIACYYESGPVSSGNLTAELSPGDYHLVFVNNEPGGPRISIGADIKFVIR